MDKRQAAEQLRAAIGLTAQTLPEETILEIAAVFPPYAVGMRYKLGDILSCGENSVGDPQLYRVQQAHTSAAEWPITTLSLYKPIGLTEDGVPLWSQPTGAHDTYNEGDKVSYDGTVYVSMVDGNAYAPGVVPGAWEVVM